MIVTVNIPGSGKDWKKAVEMTAWLKSNTDAVLFWQGLHSDYLNINLPSSEDAILFKLRYSKWI